VVLVVVGGGFAAAAAVVAAAAAVVAAVAAFEVFVGATAVMGVEPPAKTLVLPEDGSGELDETSCGVTRREAVLGAVVRARLGVMRRGVAVAAESVVLSSLALDPIVESVVGVILRFVAEVVVVVSEVL